MKVLKLMLGLFFFCSFWLLQYVPVHGKKAELKKSVYTDTVTVYYNSTSSMHSNHIPDSVFTMVNLEHLGIQGMDCDYGGNDCWEIKEIPPAIKNLKKLKSLTLNVNSIEVIPSELAELKNLTVIDFDDNAGFSEVNVLAKMTWLEELTLNGCNLYQLPQDISQWKNLKTLGLAGNNFDKKEQQRIKKALPHCRIYF
jgi:hypothetical protein